MKKIISLLIVIAISYSRVSAGDDAKQLIGAINQKFSRVISYRAHTDMDFNIPGVKMKRMQGKVIYKQPNLFKIKAKGIFFLPKQNPMQQSAQMLMDTNAYTSIISGYENIQGKRCAIVNIIPTKSQTELILGKFWIDISNPLILKSQITTKNNGTIESQHFYGQYAAQALPDKIVITIEMNKIKIPKMLSADLNKKSTAATDLQTKESGTVTLLFSQYQMNAPIALTEFTQEKE